MRPRSVASRHALDSCTLHLQAWNPFRSQPLADTPPPAASASPSAVVGGGCIGGGGYFKRPCRSDRSTAPVDLDFSRLSLRDDTALPRKSRAGDGRLRGWLAKKRRRPHGGSRSVSGRSSDRSGARQRQCCSAGAGGAASGTYATCSDFPVVAGGTDSSGELFMNGEVSWGSDASEARVGRKEGKVVGCGGGSVGVTGAEKDGPGFGFYQGGYGSSDLLGNESGYGSETGYKGDAEVGYEDEIDEEEDDGRILFWGDKLRGNNGGEFISKDAFNEMKSQPRCRRKKPDLRICDDSLRRY